MLAEEQCVVIYAGVRGFLDKIQTSEIGKFERMFLEHLYSQHKYILDTIRTKKALDKETDEKLKRILESFMGQGHFALNSSPHQVPKH